MSRRTYAAFPLGGLLGVLVGAMALPGCGGASRLDSEPILIDLADANPREYRIWINPDEKAGTVTLQPDVVEGHPASGETVLVLTSGSADRRLIRGRVVGANGEGWPVLKVPSGAFEVLKPGVSLQVLSPRVNISAAPEILPVVEGPLPSGMAPEHALRGQTVERLRKLGLALHTGNMEPAALLGPDGQRWHSWRVLILPRLGHQDLFNAYKFDEPWDGPNNIKLLDRMPDDFRIPAFGEDRGHFTHVALLNHGPRGPEQTYREMGITGIKNSPQFGTEFGMVPLSEVWDGTSNTILLGPVDPGRQIPWTKPEDVEFRPDFPGLGQPGGFATPLSHRDPSGKEVHLAPLLFYDAKVRLLPETTPREILQKLLTPNGAEDVDPYAIPSIPFAPVLLILKEGAILAGGS